MRVVALGRCNRSAMAPADGFPLTSAGAVTAVVSVVDHAVEFSRNLRFLQPLGLSGR